MKIKQIFHMNYVWLMYHLQKSKKDAYFWGQKIPIDNYLSSKDKYIIQSDFFTENSPLAYLWHIRLGKREKKRKEFFFSLIFIPPPRFLFVLGSLYGHNIVVMSPSRAGSSQNLSWRIFSSARLVTFFPWARNQKSAKNEPIFFFFNFWLCS